MSFASLGSSGYWFFLKYPLYQLGQCLGLAVNISSEHIPLLVRACLRATEILQSEAGISGTLCSKLHLVLPQKEAGKR